jgi:ketosteroid isomerase-like protein
MPTAVEDKDAIREVLAEYCFRLDGSDFDGMAALFTEDGTWDTAFGAATGRAAIAQHAAGLRARAGANRPRAIHLTTNIVVGCSVTARSTASSTNRSVPCPNRRRRACSS